RAGGVLSYHSLCDRSLPISLRDQQRTFIGIARFFPDPLIPWIRPAPRPFQGCECLDGVVDRASFEVEGEAVVSSLRVESDAGSHRDSVLTRSGAAQGAASRFIVQPVLAGECE